MDQSGRSRKEITTKAVSTALVSVNEESETVKIIQK